MNPIATLNLYDERTFEPFNISGADLIEFKYFCEGSTITTAINETTSSIPLVCDYTKFRVVVHYGTVNYYRTLIYAPADIFNMSVFLIDGITTQYLYNSLVLDDLLGDYDNPVLYVKKNIEDETVQITADSVDVENKIGAYLIENDEYILELHSDNNPIKVLGVYSADIAGEKVIQLYDLSINPQPSGTINTVSYNTGLENRSGDSYVVGTYQDTVNQTNSVTFSVREDTYNGSILFSSTVYPTNFSDEFSVDFEFNATAYINSTLFTTMEIDHQEGESQYIKMVNAVTSVSADVLQHLTQGGLNWGFTLFLGVIAIFATIRTANIVNLGMIAFAGLFVMFGWYTLSSGILSLAILVSIMSILAEGARAK